MPGLPKGCERTSPPPARRQDRPSRVVGPEIVGAVDGEELREPRARAIDPALDGAHRAFADRGRLFVGEARRPDEDKRLTLVGRQLRERYTEFLEFHTSVLLGA